MGTDTNWHRPLGFVVGAVLVISALSVGVAGDAPAGREVVVADAATGDHLLEQPVENGSLVALEYTHSVEKTRVLDAYTVRGDRLVMTRMEFESYGWGLPARAAVETTNGTFAFDPAYATHELVVKPGRIAGHELHTGGRTYDLVALSDSRAVRLSIERRSMLEAFLDRIDL